MEKDLCISLTQRIFDREKSEAKLLLKKIIHNLKIAGNKKV